MNILKVISDIAFDLFIAMFAVAGAVAIGSVTVMIIIFLYDIAKERWHEK